MSGDYETLEVNQPKISYFKKRSEDNTLWLDEMINKIEDMKNNILDAAQYMTNKGKSILISNLFLQINVRKNLRLKLSVSKN